MKIFYSLRNWALMAALLISGARADAQAFSLFATVSANSIAISNSLTYAITVTNQGAVALQNVSVTNSPSSAVQLVFASVSQGSITNDANTNSIIFNLGTITNGGSASMIWTVNPIVAGFLTNTIVVTTTTVTNIATTNLVVQVVVPSADLGVTMAGFPLQPLVNDQLTYGVSITNFGPNAVSSFTLTNTLPPGVILLNVFPTNQTYSMADSNLIFNFGALASGGGTNLLFTVEPTNAGVLTFFASIGAGLADTNAANNFASSNLTVQGFSGTLIATNFSAMVFDPQTGLFDQTIRLSNVGTDAVASARVIIAGLTNRLYNAVGTNNGNPFVIYGNTLDTNQNVDLVLEYFIPTRLPIVVSNSQYTAVGVPVVVFSAPPGTNGVFYVTLTDLPSGNKLIEFQSIPGRNYTIQYSDNDITFSNALEAQPAITAPAAKTQWIDDGPPKTISAPNSVPIRYYRVLLNP